MGKWNEIKEVLKEVAQVFVQEKWMIIGLYEWLGIIVFKTFIVTTALEEIVGFAGFGARLIMAIGGLYWIIDIKPGSFKKMYTALKEERERSKKRVVENSG